MNDKKSSFKNELKIISPIAVGIAIAAFAAMLILFAVLPKGPHDLPPFPGWFLLGLLAGLMLSAWVLLIGYINSDAARRGMGRVLWTFIAALVPNCLGILAYFLVRKPILRPCPGCGLEISPDFRFCPKCGFSLAPSCTHCGRRIEHDYVCCPYCGKMVGATGQAPVVPNHG
ncbi:MAG: zinc-ribbon domain-containing protein [Acidobacteriota bacterium]|nr:zinc-ribbon domain-containing protein [Acidobacteriota bacterium]